MDPEGAEDVHEHVKPEATRSRDMDTQQSTVRHSVARDFLTGVYLSYTRRTLKLILRTQYNHGTRSSVKATPAIQCEITLIFLVSISLNDPADSLANHFDFEL